MQSIVISLSSVVRPRLLSVLIFNSAYNSISMFCAGNQGATGFTGFPGSPGSPGFPGTLGDTGYTGFPGQPGFAGSPGFTGFSGKKNYTCILVCIVHIKQKL